MKAYSPLPFTDTSRGIINNDITPRTLRREDPSPLLPKMLWLTPGDATDHSNSLQVPFVLSFRDFSGPHGPTISMQWEQPQEETTIKNKHKLLFFFVSQFGPNYSVDWYKHWLTWAIDYTVYGTHMLALVSLINPIRAFGEMRRPMLLTATHTHTRSFLGR